MVSRHKLTPLTAPLERSSVRKAFLEERGGKKGPLGMNGQCSAIFYHKFLAFVIVRLCLSAVDTVAVCPTSHSGLHARHTIFLLRLSGRRISQRPFHYGSFVFNVNNSPLFTCAEAERSSKSKLFFLNLQEQAKQM